jgi:hypothetical protein
MVVVEANQGGNNAKTVSGNLIYDVNVPTPTPAPTVSALSATPNPITAPGSTTLSWTVAGTATWCWLGGTGGGWMDKTDGTKWISVSPPSTETYSIQCGNASGNSAVQYRVVTVNTAPTLKICLGSIYLGKATNIGTTLSTRTLPKNNFEILKAWSGVDNDSCNGTDVTSTTTWKDQSGNSTVDVTGGSTSNVTITAKVSGSETVSVPNATATPRINIPYTVPAPSCSSNCAAQAINHCKSETFTTTNSCGVSETCTKAGTRYCDMNWKEVTPGQ